MKCPSARSLAGLVCGGVLALLSTGCATVQPQTPAQTVYAAEAGLTEALAIATSYAQLPSCPQPTACSDPVTVQRMTLAGQAAASAISVARTTVTSSTASSADIQASIAAATQSLATLLYMTNQVKAP